MRYPLMLQAFIVVVHIVPEARLHRPRGVYTVQGHGIHSHEIAIPRKVSERGVLISHNVTHHHHEDGPVVHYRLSVAGNEYHIELAAVEKFIGPGLVVERRKRDVHVRTRPKNSSSKCHYRGFIRGHPNSQVALSACDGLVLQRRPARRLTFVRLAP